MAQPIIAAIEFLMVLGLLVWYKGTGNRLALTLFSVVIALVGIVQGLFNTLYGHIYKDILFLAGVTSGQVRTFFLPILPNDFIYPPNNIFFEVTGVLELLTIGLIAFFTYRLIRSRNRQ